MVFAFRHQPLRTAYLASTIVVLVFVRLPFWTLRNLLPSWRPHPSWSLGRSLIVSGFRAFVDTLYATQLMQAPTLESFVLHAQKFGFVWVEATPELVVGEIKEIAETNGVEAVRIGGFWYGPRGTDGLVGQKAEPDETVIYHLHGGGYVMGTASPKDLTMPGLFDGFIEHFPRKTRIFAVEYRLSSAEPFTPANPWPAELIDTIAGYQYLLSVGFTPSQIIVSGDSAGGHLAIAFGRYLALYPEQLPQVPWALLLLSPTVDWGLTYAGPGSSLERNAATDFIASINFSGYTARALVGRLPPGTAETSPWISPASLKLTKTEGLFKGMPRTLIVSGEVEMTLDPIRTIRDRMRADLGEESVQYLEVPAATHDFLTTTWHEPERTETFKEVAKWAASL